MPTYLDPSPAWVPVRQLDLSTPVLGGAPDRITGAGASNIPFLDLAERDEYLKLIVDDLMLDAAVELTVGPGGNFATIGEALFDMSRRRMAFINGGFTATIRLLAGFVMNEQIILKSLDLSWVRIIGTDTETLVNRGGLATAIGGHYPMFAGSEGAALPLIAQRFVMDTSGTATNRTGIYLTAGSRVTVGSGAGIRSAGGSGIVCRAASTASANGAVFTGAGLNGADAEGGSIINLVTGDVSGAGQLGIRCVTGSKVVAEACDASGCGAGGVQASKGSEVAFVNGLGRSGVANASSDLTVLSGSKISAFGATGGTSVATNTISASGVIHM